MQPVGIRLIASDLADLLLRHLGGQDEDRVGQRDLLATLILTEALAPGVREGLDEVGAGLVDILQYEHGVGIIPRRSQQRSDFLSADDASKNMGQIVSLAGS